MEITINNKYRIIHKIGEGTFGVIYKCQNIRTNEYVAIKVEPIQNGTKLLKNESKIYTYLGVCKGIPTVKWFGKDTLNYYMAINLLGESLEGLKHRYNRFSLKITLQIGISIIKLLKIIHDKGLVHRDIKPDNFLFGLDANKNKLYIIDFGFCKLYKTDEQHIALRKTNNLVGSLSYASLNAHNLLELSRRDDLESLGYLLLYMYLDKLPWQTINNNDVINNNDDIKNMKRNIIHLSGLPEIYKDYLNYVRKLEFESEPDYNYLIDIFQKELEKKWL